MKTFKATVFDIKRFAIHDGSGLRTTVFLKGCPLRCKWCQNPEGLSPKRRPIYFENSCIHCQRCVQASKQGQMEYKDNRPYFHLEYKEGFDNLIRACPANAIRYDSQEYDVDELFELIMSDRVFYRDDGGVTFSGGEPLMHAKFLLEILKRCKEAGIRTAIETTLYAHMEDILPLLPYLDLIYVDLKIFDDAWHKTCTGVSVQPIQAHIQYLLQSEHRDKVIIRTPLIPTMSATDENIHRIAKFLIEIDPDVHYELLNYNPLDSAKYDLVDLKYGVDLKYKMYTKEQMRHFYDVVYQTGLKNLIVE